MICGKKQSIIFFLLLLALSQLCFALSEDEKEQLQELDKQTLIAIILTYDNNLNLIEKQVEKRTKALDLREQNLNRREINLAQREARQQRQEASLIARESLLVSLSESHEKSRKDSFWHGFALGNATGFTLGGLSGYGLNELIP